MHTHTYNRHASTANAISSPVSLLLANHDPHEEETGANGVPTPSRTVAGDVGADATPFSFFFFNASASPASQGTQGMRLPRAPTN